MLAICWRNSVFQENVLLFIDTNERRV